MPFNFHDDTPREQSIQVEVKAVIKLGEDLPERYSKLKGREYGFYFRLHPGSHYCGRSDVRQAFERLEDVVMSNISRTVSGLG